MRVRLLAAVAAVLVSAGLAPAQWSVTDAGGPAFYPPYDYAAAVLPDGTPAAGLVSSPGGAFVAGRAAFKTAAGVPFTRLFRLNAASQEVEYLDAAAAGFGYCQDVLAVADDGAAVVQGLAGWWPTAAVWKPGAAAATPLACQFGPLAPQWALQSCWYLRANGDGTYTAKGTGYQAGVFTATNFVLTGPLPE